MLEDIALQIARQTSKDVWSVEETIETIQKEIEAREISRKLAGSEKRRNASKQQTRTPVGKYHQILCDKVRNYHKE